jgi:hypothetical protein
VCYPPKAVARALLAALALAVVASSVAPSPAVADGTGCLPAPLPVVPAPPVVSTNVARGSEVSHLDVWRQACSGGGSIVLLRVTPLTAGALTCDLSYKVVQGGSQFDVVLTDDNDAYGFCDSVFVPTTFYLAPSGPAYDPTQPFTLVFDTVTASPRFVSLPVSGAGAPGRVAPTITVVPTACTTCHSGQVVGYVMSLNNPGAPMVVELKGGARFPDGTILALASTTATLPSGASALTLVPAQALPLGLPTVDLLVEAAVLDPSLGVTLSRHSVILHLLP